ncbi:hypothetical protein AZ78_3427 [Lysobacter capsici AZ78]|uniref:Uncharacterized protein n=1 Tax=Lysobacter capsici AZ78 TaxID=1444315 RepID=A0A120AHA6_9GAMM|nr:hypothetical protein AZ78_3427 [Lysobacter capsici AZ78]
MPAGFFTQSSLRGVGRREAVASRKQTFGHALCEAVVRVRAGLVRTPANRD